MRVRTEYELARYAAFVTQASLPLFSCFSLALSFSFNLVDSCDYLRDREMRRQN